MESIVLITIYMLALSSGLKRHPPTLTRDTDLCEIIRQTHPCLNYVLTVKHCMITTVFNQ